uniref:Uncharacterized protein n=1 Tax=Sphaerodactylus townsendi TaxID=933632 RepID=A0ACB8G6F7_9SAUR
MAQLSAVLRASGGWWQLPELDQEPRVAPLSRHLVAGLGPGAAVGGIIRASQPLPGWLQLWSEGQRERSRAHNDKSYHGCGLNGPRSE